MYLKLKKNGHLIQVTDIADLINPNHTHVVGRLHYGEEIQDPERYAKSDLVFPSGETLPACWLDPHYRDDEIRK